METTRFGSCELLFCGWKLRTKAPFGGTRRAKKPFTWNFPPQKQVLPLEFGV